MLFGIIRVLFFFSSIGFLFHSPWFSTVPIPIPILYLSRSRAFITRPFVIHIVIDINNIITNLRTVPCHDICTNNNNSLSARLFIRIRNYRAYNNYESRKKNNQKKTHSFHVKPFFDNICCCSSIFYAVVVACLFVQRAFHCVCDDSYL